MKHILDRPVWSALTSRHAALSEGGALGRLAGPDESLLIVQAAAIVLPREFAAVTTAFGVQMILRRTAAKVSDQRIVRLTDADPPDMLALATLTKPGPFSLRAQALGAFFGVKQNGRLVAMAGERMKQAGFAELSGVCVHPDFRRRGLGRLLSMFMAHRIRERGETPYLHAYATNAAAIGLYESIGFELRTMMNVAMIRAQG